MDVTQEPFLDRGEPDGAGLHGWWYEGTWITFTFGGGRTLRARRYRDTPREVSLFFDAGGPQEGDPETGLAVDWLHDAGVDEVNVLGGAGYRPISS